MENDRVRAARIEMREFVTGLIEEKRILGVSYKIGEKFAEKEKEIIALERMALELGRSVPGLDLYEITQTWEKCPGGWDIECGCKKCKADVAAMEEEAALAEDADREMIGDDVDFGLKDIGSK